jgi:glycosyltransferase involved in cell wall biosynthesis
VRLVFWQRMFSPHMMGLAEAMAARGHEVHFMALEELSDERRRQGWHQRAAPGVNQQLIHTREQARTFIEGLPVETVHLTQGLRGNGKIGAFQKLIAESNQRHWVIMETVNDSGWRGRLKRLVYNIISRLYRERISGILAIGKGTSDWLVERGFFSPKVFPFAYFIPVPVLTPMQYRPEDEFIFGYIGNLEPWKNPALALRSFLRLDDSGSQFIVVGDGSERLALENLVRLMETKVKVEFYGRVPMPDVPNILSKLDCLILPSNEDGWGVVASEAMLLGIPVICSDRCGVRGAVAASPFGMVFPAGDEYALAECMLKARRAYLDQSDIRLKLAAWAYPLRIEYGARYLESILNEEMIDDLPTWLRKPKC